MTDNDDFIHSLWTKSLVGGALATSVSCVASFFAAVWTTGDYWPTRLAGTAVLLLFLACILWVLSSFCHSIDMDDQARLHAKQRRQRSSAVGAFDIHDR